MLPIRVRVVVFAVLSLLSAFLASPAAAQVSSITLVWTAAGDDTTAGTAAGYEIRYRAGAADTTGQAVWLASGGRDTNVPTGAATFWTNATRYAGTTPAPVAGGQTQTATLAGPGPNGSWPAGTWSFEVRTCDDGLPQPDGVPVVHCARSNITVRVVPLQVQPDISYPNPVKDLRSQ